MDIKETITSDINATTLELLIRVTMISRNSATFEFTSSIDELGQIVLTPFSTDVEFIAANIDENFERESASVKQESTSVNGAEVTTKECTILITGNMLCESDNTNVSVVIDEIGQLLICPQAAGNMFVTASFSDSLNLVTEELQVTEYIGHKLVNSGDGWDIFTPEGDTLEEGVATLSEAKIIVCKSELAKLQGDSLCETALQEDKTEVAASEEEPVASPEVTAEVITESNSNTAEEKKHDIITRFLQGNIALFSDNGTPLESYLHVEELDSNGYSYYYDTESDAIVSYPNK